MVVAVSCGARSTTPFVRTASTLMFDGGRCAGAVISCAAAATVREVASTAVSDVTRIERAPFFERCALYDWRAGEFRAACDPKLGSVVAGERDAESEDVAHRGPVVLADGQDEMNRRPYPAPRRAKRRVELENCTVVV